MGTVSLRRMLLADYDLVALPVVDEHDELVGQVTVDDIVDVIHEEATEDNLKMAATSSREMEDPVLGVVRRRLPWLLFCLAGTLLTGGVLDLFSGVLSALSPLVLFVPAVMAMGGNSGIQTSTVTVRALATGALRRGRVGPALWRELRAAAGIGLLLGTVVFLVAHLAHRVAACAASPWGIDPAVASGPLITTLNDILSLVIYFGVAGLLLRWNA